MVRTAKLFLAFQKHIREPECQMHAIRVEQISVLIGKAMGLNNGDLENLRYAALLHDIGKAALPGEILKKQLPLSSEEISLYRLHPCFGWSMLKFDPVIAESVRHHHENWNGSGYPDQIAGDRIPLFSRIIRVADCIDMRVIQGWGSNPIPLTRFFEHIKERAGSTYDPRVVEAILKIKNVLYRFLLNLLL